MVRNFAILLRLSGCQLMPSSKLSGFSCCLLNRDNQYHSLPLVKCVPHRSYTNKYRTNPDVAPSAIHNVQSICSKWAEHFKRKKIPEPKSSAELIVAHVLGGKTLRGFAPWQIVPKVKTDEINDLCKLRLERMPVQYIIEEWDFRDLVLQMQPPVLIPRPETEELITYIQQYQTIHSLPSPKKILEIGCGTGAIILSLCKEYPLSYCLGIDQCPTASQLTRKNANNHALIVHIENVKFDDHTVKEEKIFDGSFDLVVSNPPYVKTADLENLIPEIIHYEDVLGALDGGANGLSIILSILRNAKHLLNQNGLLWLEVDPSHPDQITLLTEQHPEWQLQYIKTYKDFLDKPRFCLLSHC